MKKIILSFIVLFATTKFIFAGGDIVPVEPVVETPVPMPIIAQEDETVVSNSGIYVGLGYSMLISESSFATVASTYKLDTEYSAVMFNGGYKFNEYIAIEGRYWLGLTDGEFAFSNPILGKFNTDTQAWGVYAKPMYPVTDTLDIYGLLGYGSVSMNGIAFSNGNILDVDVSGITWGAGVSYSFTENIAVFADYVDFQDESVDVAVINGKLEHAFYSVNLGVTYTF